MRALSLAPLWLGKYYKGTRTINMRRNLRQAKNKNEAFLNQTYLTDPGLEVKKLEISKKLALNIWDESSRTQNSV
jgi:hypothetical protein